VASRREERQIMSVAEIKLEQLKKRVDWLEQTVRDLRDRAQAPTAVEREKLSEREWLLAELKDQGLIRDLTPGERARAERWRELPDAEKEAHIRYMRSLVLDPPLSEIIIEDRR
jgi:hypothetical protein